MKKNVTKKEVDALINKNARQKKIEQKIKQVEMSDKKVQSDKIISTVANCGGTGI